MLDNIIDRLKNFSNFILSREEEVTDEQIREHLYESAKSGNKDDQYGYACFCLCGLGGPVNLGHGEYWLDIAASNGHVDAQFALGECYYFGELLKKDLEKGKYWLIVAATNEHETAKDYLKSEIFAGSEEKLAISDYAS